MACHLSSPAVKGGGNRRHDEFSLGAPLASFLDVAGLFHHRQFYGEAVTTQLAVQLRFRGTISGTETSSKIVRDWSRAAFTEQLVDRGADPRRAVTVHRRGIPRCADAGSVQAVVYDYPVHCVTTRAQPGRRHDTM